MSYIAIFSVWSQLSHSTVFIKYCFSYVKIDAFPDTVDPHAGLFGRGGFKL